VKPDRQSTEVTVDAVCELFTKHAATYYRDPDGKPTSEIACYRAALGPLRAIAGELPAAQFGPSAFREVVDRMVGLGWSRGTINGQASRVRNVFKWAASREVVDAGVYQSLTTRSRQPAWAVLLHPPSTATMAMPATICLMGTDPSWLAAQGRR
jgi:hypothetical protein